MTDTLQNRCRICLDVGSNHVSVLGDPTVYLHIKTCLSINVLSNDDLPKKVCNSCVSQLREFYNFQLNAKCSQDWLESIVNEKKKSTELKVHVQPLPDSEYNSDSLLEFLNNTANIEEYLNNLGKDDIPSIVNMLDRTAEVSSEKASVNQKSKQLSPKKKEALTKPTKCVNMDIDVLDSDIEIVKEILMKEIEPKKNSPKNRDQRVKCFGCKAILENVHKLCEHLDICDMALRTCVCCNMLFNSKTKLKQHLLVHSDAPLTCNCGSKFVSQDSLVQHCKSCKIDHVMVYLGYTHRCKECGETFKERFQLYRHAKNHVIASQKRMCDICGHSYLGDEELTRHKKDRHGIIEGHLYKCKICSLTGNNRKEIYQHIQRHLDLQDVHQLLCEHCGKSFSTRNTLLRHSQQHETVEIHTCDLCNSTFPNAKVKDEHVLGHTEISMCEKCGVSVLSNRLSAHCCELK